MSISEQFDDGGQAFPSNLPGGNYQIPGMSMLDWFAGQALIGVVMLNENQTYKQDADDAYQFAIAMLNERERLNAVNP